VSRITQAREAAAEGYPAVEYAEPYRDGKFDKSISVQIALRASLAERDLIVAWLRNWDTIGFGEDGDFDRGARFALDEAADALARDAHHGGNDDT
jgi:hypothetical protein